MPHPASAVTFQFSFCSLFTEVAAAFPILSAKLLQLQLYLWFNTSMKYLSDPYLTDEESPPPPVAGNRLFSVYISRSGKKLISTTSGSMQTQCCQEIPVKKLHCCRKVALMFEGREGAQSLLTAMKLFKEPKKAAIHYFLLTFQGKQKGDITFYFQ